MSTDVSAIFKSHIQLMTRVSEQLSPLLEKAAIVMSNALQDGKKILIMGNGGSAADSQHFVAELVGRFKHERQALAAISLTDNNSTLTAVGNDYHFEVIFQRQIEALANPGDIVIGISTSGRSKNVLLALQEAQQIGCVTFGLLGGDGGDIAAIVDTPIIVDSQETPRIQEAHITIIHILCELIEEQMLTGESDKK
jgi:D-sedoheptulose 7-phosphate isomerase